MFRYEISFEALLIEEALLIQDGVSVAVKHFPSFGF